MIKLIKKILIQEYISIITCIIEKILMFHIDINNLFCIICCNNNNIYCLKINHVFYFIY